MPNQLFIISIEKPENTGQVIDSLEEMIEKCTSGTEIYSFYRWQGTKNVKGISINDSYGSFFRVTKILKRKLKFHSSKDFHTRSQRELIQAAMGTKQFTLITDSLEQENGLIALLGILPNQHGAEIEAIRIQAGTNNSAHLVATILQPQKGIHVLPAWIDCGSSTTFNIIRQELSRINVMSLEILVNPYSGKKTQEILKGWQMRPTAPNQIFAINDLTAKIRFIKSFILDKRVRSSIVYSQATIYSAMNVPRFWKKLLMRINPDVVYVNHYFNLPIAKRLIGKKCKPYFVLDTHDIQSVNYSDQKYQTRFTKIYNGFQEMRRSEFLFLESPDLLVFVNKQEEYLYSQSSKNLQQKTITSIPVDFKSLSENPTALYEISNYATTQDSMIVMSNNRANQLSIDWFIQKVLPFNPTFHVTIVGSIKDYVESKYDTTNKYTNLTCRGVLEDLDNEYLNHKVVLIPVLIGGGISIKTLEAMRYKKIIISTKKGMRGISVQESDWVQDDPKSFATVWRDVLNDSSLQNKFRSEVSEWATKLQTETYAEKVFPSIVSALSKNG